MGITGKTEREIELMRQAGAIVATVLDELKRLVEPGVTTAELDRVAEARIREMGGEPSFKGYHGYPATICASINEEIVHGIPKARALQEGDIISIDVGVIWQGYQGDAAITAPVGRVAARTEDLLRATREALRAGISAAKAGVPMGDVSHAIELAAEAAGFRVVREYGGHGIGREMHEDPRIPNWGKAGRGPRLVPGMTICLEPMLTAGGSATRVLGDRWTVVTADGSLSAHSEHTIVVTDEGGEILTRVDHRAL